MVRKLLNLSLLCWYSKFSFTTSITITHPLNILPLLVYYTQKNNYCQISRYLPIAIFCGAFQTYPGLCRSCMNTSLFIGLIKNFKSRKKNLLLYTYYKKKKLLSIEIKPLSEGTYSTVSVDHFDLFKLGVIGKLLYLDINNLWFISR